MSKVKEQIFLSDARVVSVTYYPTKDGESHVLLLQAPLTHELADRLKCRSMLFDLNDNVRPFEGNIGLTLDDSQSEICVGGVPNLYPSRLWKAKVFHSKREAKEGETGLEFTIRAVFNGDHAVAPLAALKDRVKNGNFDIGFNSLQQGFDFGQGQPTTDGPEGGTRVEMSAGPATESGDDEPPAPVIAAVMEGQPVKSALEEADAGTLPSAREMGGTHQRGGPKRRRNPDESVEAIPGEVVQ